MSHLEGGTIVAIRDGALIDADAMEHMDGCSHCQSVLDDAVRRADVISGALATLDAPVDVGAAKAAVRARLDVEREEERRRPRSLRGDLGRAATILLVAAGAAYAVPGSPLGAWLDGDPGDGAAVEIVAPAGQEVTHEGGIEVNVSDGRIAVVVTGAAPRSTLEVVWTDRATARIAAPAGSSFSFAEGRAEAAVEPGPVRVELPRFAPVVSVEVDGVTYLSRASGSLRVLEPAVERTDDRITFVVRPR